ncbi:HD domain-containing protein [Leucothrix sargassi]|nr:HD domain-containing protein [Leucothrix sargassi]
MSKILLSLYETMSIAAFRHTHRDGFELITRPPTWLSHFTEAHITKKSIVPLEGLFPFLDCFLAEAFDVWETQSDSPHRSGPWVEFTPDDQEFPLEATAIYLEGESILVIQDLGEEYYNEASRLQTFREQSLDKEKLEREVIIQTEKIRAREEEIAMALLAASGHRDHETAEHVRRIGLYAEALARELGWERDKAADLRIAAAMHDIGKIGIPDKILLKPGKLTVEEFEIMKGHPEIGADMLNKTEIPLLNMAAQVSLCHHERWDGTGYPRGLKGEEIPVEARITSIVDVYDALVHKRVYKKASTEQAALTLMKQMVGKHFDPTLFQLFLKNLPKMQRIRQAYAEPSEQSTVSA